MFNLFDEDIIITIILVTIAVFITIAVICIIRTTRRRTHLCKAGVNSTSGKGSRVQPSYNTPHSQTVPLNTQTVPQNNLPIPQNNQHMTTVSERIAACNNQVQQSATQQQFNSPQLEQNFVPYQQQSQQSSQLEKDFVPYQQQSQQSQQQQLQNDFQPYQQQQQSVKTTKNFALYHKPGPGGGHQCRRVTENVIDAAATEKYIYVLHKPGNTLHMYGTHDFMFIKEVKVNMIIKDSIDIGFRDSQTQVLVASCGVSLYYCEIDRGADVLVMQPLLGKNGQHIQAKCMRYDAYGKFLSHSEDETIIQPINKSSYIQCNKDHSLLLSEGINVKSKVGAERYNIKKDGLTKIPYKNICVLRRGDGYELLPENDNYANADKCKLYISDNGVTHNLGFFNM